MTKNTNKTACMILWSVGQRSEVKFKVRRSKRMNAVLKLQGGRISCRQWGSYILLCSVIIGTPRPSSLYEM